MISKKWIGTSYFERGTDEFNAAPDFMQDVWTRMARAHGVMESFVQSFEECPTHALVWSRDVFEKTAFFSAAGEITYAYQDDPALTVDQVVTTLRRDVMRLARSANSYSTSATSNLMEACELAAKADLLELFGWKQD